MSRDTRRSSGRRLRAVPDPPRLGDQDARTRPRFKRKSAYQWRTFAFKGLRRRSYALSYALHDYERQLILEDLRELGTAGTADLQRLRPGRYDAPTLRLALKRMVRNGDLDRVALGRRRWHKGVVVKIRKTEEEQRARESA